MRLVFDLIYSFTTYLFVTAALEGGYSLKLVLAVWAICTLIYFQPRLWK